MLPERLDKIMEIARHDGRVSVEVLSQRFRVTQQTIRKDLDNLCQKRLLVRIHGGAVISSGVENVSYEARRLVASEAKEAIGHTAADMIPNNISLFMNIGTTTEAVARALLQHEGLHVITNSINVAGEMRGAYPKIEVVIAGGTVRSADGLIAGEPATDFIHQFKVDFCIIGTSAIDEDGTLLNYDHPNVKVIQAMIANSRKVILVADATKFERTAPVRIAKLDQIDTLVTDHCTHAHIRKLCFEAGTELIEANEAC